MKRTGIIFFLSFSCMLILKAQEKPTIDILRKQENIVQKNRENAYDSILWHAEEQLRTAQILGDSIEIGRAYLSMSFAYQNLEVFQQQVEYILKAKAMFANQDEEWLAKAVYELAWIYADVDFDAYQVGDLLNYCIEQFRKSGNTQWLVKSYALYGLSFIYREKDPVIRKDSGLYYLNKAQNFYRNDLKPDETFYKILLRKAFFHSIEPNMDLNKTIQLYDEVIMGSNHLTVNILAQVRRARVINQKLGGYAEYHQDLLRYYELCKQLRPNWFQNDVAKYLYEYHKAQGNFDSALFYNNIYHEYNTKLALRGKEYLDLVTQNLQHQAQDAEQQKALAEANLNKQQVLLLTAAGTIVVLIIFLVIIYRKNQEINRVNDEVIQKHRMIETLLKEIHHRVKNNLQMIVGLLDLQRESIHDEAVEVVLNEASNRIKSIALIHQRLYKGDSDMVTVGFKKYMEEITDNLLFTYNMLGKVDVNLDVDEMTTSFDKAIIFGLLVNEIISNSLKHAFVGVKSKMLSIQVKHIGNSEVSLTIKDNGIGLPDGFDEKRDSFGVDMIRTFVKDLEGEVRFENNQGATVQVRLNHFNSVAEEVFR